MNSFIFDVDGTLIDSERIFYDSLQYALDLHNISPKTDIQGLFGLTAGEALAKLGLTSSSIVGAAWETRFEELSEKAPFYNGIQDTFRLLHMRNAKIVIVTSRGHATVDSLWKNSSLAPYIDFCVAAEDTVQHKPHPEPLLLAMSTLKLEPDATIYIGDTINDYTAAKKAGIAFAAAAWNEKAISLPGIRLASPTGLLDLL